MAALNDLIEQISDAALRARIQREVDALTKQKKFGLVFEEHLPECTPLYGFPVKVKSKVAKKSGKVNEMYLVKEINGNVAICEKLTDHSEESVPIDELVRVAEFGEPIYPQLVPIDSIENAPDGGLWHTLIQADNYHALQLLEYLYPQKVDCIYIDPPYNTGARDWKYNNDYVDSADSYRHSKWLSMMEKRLKIAKKLLNPNDSVLIVTIDEKEYLHLGCLLEEMFPEARMEMVSSVINPSGAGGRNEFSRVDEYIFFMMFGGIKICKSKDDMLFSTEDKSSSRIKGGLSWESFLRSGQSNIWTKKTSLCYPILVDEETLQVIECLEPIKGPVPSLPKYIDGKRAIYPMKDNGKLGIWRLTAPSFMALYNQGYAYISTYDKSNDRYALKYLLSGTVDRIANGEISVQRPNSTGPVVSDDDYSALTMPKTVWNRSSHNAGKSGSDILNKIYGDNRFPYPKSLYAVEDAIRFFVANKPNALIVDFFAGSGTTLHAVNLLNAEDGGHRRCILVTNNEVSDAEAKDLTARGFKPGDDEWEKLGIAQHDTWPRTVCSIEGHDVNGNPLKGNYIGSDLAMSDGFKANAAFFKLGFLDKNQVALGKQFKEILPILWMKSGAVGKMPTVEGDVISKMLILPQNKMAVLIDEKYYLEFFNALEKDSEIKTLYFITDSDAGYCNMIQGFKDKKTYQLYKDYLDNFRINAVRRE